MSAPAPKLILLPGLDGTAKLFSDFIAALAPEFEALTVAYPPDRCLPYADLVAIVQSNLPTPEPFILVAESFSTPIAIQCAAMHPQGLKGLVLCSGFASSPVLGARRLAYSLLTPGLLRMPLSDFALKTALVGPTPSPELLLAVRNTVSSVNTDVIIARVREVLNCDVRAFLAQVCIPILCIRAKQDRLVSSRSSEEIRRLKPRTAVVEMAGPHLLLQREPQATAKGIAEFVHMLT